MGEIVKMVCRECGHAWKGRTGCGVNHARLDSVISLFNEDVQKNILRQTEGSTRSFFTFGYRPAYCQRCCDIVSVPVIQLLKENTNYIGECPTCSAEIESEYLKDKLVCPTCGGQQFDVIREGFWD